MDELTGTTAPTADSPPIVTGDSATDVMAAQAAAGEGPATSEPDFAFVLRLFGVNPAKYTLAGGALDRTLLGQDMDAYRSLFANRVTHGRFA